MEALPYEYQPLAEGEFRLIRFLDGDDNLSCELEHFNLDSAPSYWALSYTWGTEEDTSSLSLNGRTLAIRENLRAALEKIGKHVKDAQAYLWVDAICINQQDVAERNVQVMRMKSIYTDAAHVAIWLGEHAENSELAVASIIQFSNRMAFLQSPEGGNHRYVDLHFALQLEIDTPVYENALQAISYLCQRPWFGRLWIVQESTASNDRIFFVGNESFRWGDFQVWLWVSDLTVLYRHYYGRFQLLHQLSKDRDSNSATTILALCRRFRRRQCTDPRDKVYALASIASDLQDVNFIANYSVPVEDVYIDFIRLQLQISERYSELDFLGCVTRNHLLGSKLNDQISNGLPTWVPDWRPRLSVSPFRKPPFRPTQIVENGMIRQNSNERIYSASRDTLFQGRIANTVEFHVQGFVVSRVLRLSPIMEDDYLAPDDHGPALSWAVSNGDVAYDTNETRQQAFFRTITADLWYAGSERRRPHSYEVHDGEAAERKTEAADPNNHFKYISHNSMFEATRLRRFLWTNEGRMGLAPGAADINDKICVFFGGQVLYVLREVAEGKHEFMGECYVHGLMDGEALDPDGKFKDQIEEFILV